MAEASKIFVCRGGDTAAYRSIWKILPTKVGGNGATLRRVRLFPQPASGVSSTDESP